MSIYVGNKRYALLVGSTRRKMMIENALSYDAEIEYLQSSGTQYIATSYVPQKGDSFYIEFLLKEALSTTYQTLYSAGTGTYQVIHLLAKTSSNNPNGAYYKHFASGGAQNFTYSPSLNIWYSLNVSSNGVATIGNYTSTSTPSGELDGNDITLWLYKRRNNTSPFIGSIRRFYAERDGNKVIDLIPVRVGQTGYMYDKVSGELFGNSGTGDFVLGNDIT